MTTTNTTIAFHISSGELNAMYTLRRSRLTIRGKESHYHESFVCNLSMDAEVATAKAQQIVDRTRAQFEGETGVRIVFEGEPDFDLIWEGGVKSTRLSAQDINNIGVIEYGHFPFGKYKDTRIDLAPDSYIMYFATMTNDEKPATQALVAACTNVAIERDLFKKRDDAKAERDAAKAKSKHFGVVGERSQIEGVLTGVFSNEGYNGVFFVHNITVGDDIITYIGSRRLGEVNDFIQMSARVHKHDDYKGTLTTQVKHPTKIQIRKAA